MSTSLVFRHAAKLCSLTAVAALCLVLGGCGSKIKTSPTVLNAKASGERAHETAMVAEGQTLTVRLPTKGGTNYLWRMTGDNFRNPMVELERRQDQIAANGQFAAKGETAWDVFTFRAKRTGHVSVSFNYEHRYSVNDPIKTYALDVDVVTPEIAVASAGEM